ncbi:MAG: TonB-dependent receptor, partial [Thermodesulfovibrionales bacterium]|nr:TonB-dependent receptor [Thermodesulfovibrionales bacterium]
GVKLELPSKTKIEASVFYYDIKDYINFDLINFISYNIDRAKIYGIELEVSQQLGKGFSVFGNYTLQQSKTKGDPLVSEYVALEDRGFSKISGLPTHKINLGVQYKGSKKEKITLYTKYVSSQDVIYNNNQLYNTDLRVYKQSGFTTADLEASYPINKNIDITFYCKNIFNKSYQERYGYPAAERNIGFGIKAIF